MLRNKHNKQESEHATKTVNEQTTEKSNIKVNRRKLTNKETVIKATGMKVQKN